MWRIIYKFYFFLLVILITSCGGSREIIKFQTNSECYIPDLNITIGECFDSLNLNHFTFSDYTDDSWEDYFIFNLSDSLFESRIGISYEYNVIESIGITKEFKKMRSTENKREETDLEYLKQIWLNCNIPVDTIEKQLQDIMKSIKSDSSNLTEFYTKNRSGMKEYYSWGYNKKSFNNYSSLYIYYNVD